MKFKIFGLTVFIGKDKNIGQVFKRENSDEEIGVTYGNTPQLTKLDSLTANCVWGKVRSTFFGKDKIVKSLIPSIKMFRDSYQKIRGISIPLCLAKTFIESKTISVGPPGSGRYQYYPMKTYIRVLDKMMNKEKKNA